MDYLLIRRADVGVTIIALPPGLLPAETLAKWEQSALPAWLPVAATRVVADPPIPASRRWRDAWTLTGGAITVPLARARAVRKRELIGYLIGEQQVPGERDGRLKRVLAKREQAADEAEEAEELGDAAKAAQLRTKVWQLRKRAKELRGLDGTIDEQLAAVTDLVALDTFQPAELMPVD